MPYRENKIEEVSTYPLNNNILYHEGVYPNKTQTGPKSL
jgi:hypothetical protein